MGNLQNTILVVAPHPDDETLGCGGTILKSNNSGAQIHWLIITAGTEELGFSKEAIQKRNSEIELVTSQYGFSKVHRLDFPTTTLDTMAISKLVQSISRVILEVEPNTVYLPYRNDVHSDHTVVFDATVACTKTFRYPFIKSIYAYETLSETEFGLRPDDPGFRPNLFIDISEYLDNKIDIMKLYIGETGNFPFPRSEESIRALAMYRGTQSSSKAAEAFMILKEIR